jgi:hypothetical protein
LFVSETSGSPATKLQFTQLFYEPTLSIAWFGIHHFSENLNLESLKYKGKGGRKAFTRDKNAGLLR